MRSRRVRLISLFAVVLAVGMLVARRSAIPRSRGKPPGVAWKTELQGHQGRTFVVAHAGSVFVVEEYSAHGWRLDLSGRVLWHRALSQEPDTATCRLMVGGDGKLYLLVNRYSYRDTIAELLPDGRLVHERVLGWKHTVELEGFAVDRKGCTYAVGVTASGDQIRTLKLDKRGKLLWSKDQPIPDCPAGVFFNDFFIDEPENIQLVGHRFDCVSAWNGFLAEFDRRGRLAKISSLGPVTAEPEIIMPDGNGGVIVAGRAYTDIEPPGRSVIGRFTARIRNWGFKRRRRTSGNSDCFVVRFGRAGNEMWFRQHLTKADDALEDACTDAKGNTYVVGAGPVGGAVADHQPFVLKYDTRGTLLWRKDLHIPGGLDDAVITVDGKGGIYIGGGHGLAGTPLLMKLVERR